MTNVDSMIEYFNKMITHIFDLHAPIKTSRITKSPAPWITENIKFMIRLRKKALSRYKRSRSEASLSEYRQLRNLVTMTIRNEKKSISQSSV